MRRLARHLVILGAGGHAKVVADLLTLLPEWHVVGLLSANPADPGFFGLPVLGTDDALPRLRHQGVEAAAIAIGDNAARAELGALAQRHGFTLPSLMHPAAIVSTFARIAEGAVVMAGASVGPDARLGRLVVVNTRAVVEHDCAIGDAAHIAPCAALGGKVDVGALTLVGIGAAVRPGVRIGRGTIVGAGAAVVSDLDDGVVAMGTPARVRTRTGLATVGRP